jgi:hypothetical protein
VTSADTAEARVRARAEHDHVIASGGHLIQQMAFRDVPDDDGDLTIELDLSPRLTNPRGGLQGGLMATKPTWWPAGPSLPAPRPARPA